MFVLIVFAVLLLKTSTPTDLAVETMRLCPVELSPTGNLSFSFMSPLFSFFHSFLSLPSVLSFFVSNLYYSRLVNKMASKVGPQTLHVPTGEELDVYDAAERYINNKQDLVVLAGVEYGSGSSRDWAAKYVTVYILLN